MNCRHCDTQLIDVFADLDYSPISNAMLSKEQLNEPESYFPLKIFVCSKCFLVQIDEMKKADQIFDEQYTYFSSFSSTWLEHAKKYVDMMIERFGFSESSQVIEIASNDGYLLQYFKGRGVPVLGIEPTANTAIKIATEPAIANIHQVIFILYAKAWSHLCIAHHANGKAKTQAINTSSRKSLDNNATTFVTLAPKTFLTPISLLRCSAINVTNPNNPKQAINTANMANTMAILPARCSLRYISSKDSLKKR